MKSRSPRRVPKLALPRATPRHPYTLRVVALHRRHRTPYDFVYRSRPYLIYPNVFSPAYGNSSCFVGEGLANHNIFHGKRVLDMGTGCGIQAIVATYLGASRVSAVDISPYAVRCAQANVRLHGFGDRVSVARSDLFSELNGDRGFDLVIADLPFVCARPRNLLEMAFFDYRHRTLAAFLRQARRHLRPAGKIFLTFSNLCQHRNWLEASIHEYGYHTLSIHASVKDGYEWLLYCIN